MNNYDVEREITRMTENRKLPMNERIRELAEQARKKPLGNSWCYTDPAEFEQKFAELIVREMCQVINADCELQYNEGITTNLGGLNQARELIKQHFGVEEA
jgi:hypothetical protein